MAVVAPHGEQASVQVPDCLHTVDLGVQPCLITPCRHRRNKETSFSPIHHSLYVSGKLPTYPSPKPTFCLSEK